ncbi:hypothetical protein L9F63_023980, partial [Diploptera punctata]
FYIFIANQIYRLASANSVKGKLNESIGRNFHSYRSTRSLLQLTKRIACFYLFIVFCKN